LFIIRSSYAVLRNGPNPGIAQFRTASRSHRQWRSDCLRGRCDSCGRAPFRLARSLKFRERVERFEEVSRNYSIVAQVHLPSVGGHNHEADCNCVVRVEVFGAVLDEVARLDTLGGGTDVEDSGLDATRAEAAPVRVREAQDERVLGGILRVEGVAKTAKAFFVFVVVFLGQDHDGRGAQAPALSFRWHISSV
jgi:hypothetical protein